MPHIQTYLPLFLAPSNYSTSKTLQIGTDQCQKLATRRPIEGVIGIVRGCGLQNYISIASMTCFNCVVNINQLNGTWDGPLDGGG